MPPLPPTPGFLAALRHGALAAALLLLAGQAGAQHAGLRSITVAADTPIPVALFYPTDTPARAIPMGPWQPVVAPGAPASPVPLKGLILISHGTGGMELNHHDLASRLAREGYLVAALRHPGDNWQDRSLIATGRYLDERPRQISRVLDALLASPEWGPRIPPQRIGAIGHSAGGYSVLALAGGQAQGRRSADHCRAVQDDPGFCLLARAPVAPGAAAPGPAGAGAEPRSTPPAGDAAASGLETVSVADRRIRAVVALAPMAVVFTPESLATLTVPVRILMAEHDTVLNGKYHGAHVAAHLPQGSARAPVATVVPGAGHFAFMAQAGIPLPSAAGDAAANPPGFDRPAFLAALENQLVAFFASQWP